MTPTQTETPEYRQFWQTKPGTLSGRFLRHFWHPVYRSQDLAAGQAVPIHILSEKFTLYRGESGAVHMVAPRCAHRGTQLSTGWVEDDCVRCLYHGWKYDATGQCVEQPGEDESFATKVRIASYPAVEYLGLVFGYFGEGEPPPLQRQPDFEDDGILDLELPEYWPCNYFNRVDNACDIGHVAFTHFEAINRERQASGRQRRYDRSWTCEETNYGIKTMISLDGEPAEQFDYHMPIANQNSEGASLHRGGLDRQGSRNRRISWRVPVDDGNTVSFSVNLLQLTPDEYEEYQERRRKVAVVDPEAAGDAILAGKLRERELDSSFPRPALFSVEDYVTQVGQGPIAPREHDHLGKNDHGVILLRKLWERELRALAEGKPLKDWTSKDGD
ncbi:MAG TPA: Rieske 2Fe-2S domain-containing protein [Chloroflexota bacterium]|nr:Rieske 2Fe-2S domain-containing protein [Chloroflexota bacterium]